MNKHIKIVVIGGSGLIGTKLVNNLRQHGQEVVAASPSSLSDLAIMRQIETTPCC